MNIVEMYAEEKTLDMSIFSEQEHNLCPVDGKLSLKTYVQDCHDWWFDLN